MYLEVAEKIQAAHKAKRRVSVSEMLKHLDVLRSGYFIWIKHAPYNTEQRHKTVKNKIKDIFSHAGKIREYNITKKEWVLDGNTVVYGSASVILWYLTLLCHKSVFFDTGNARRSCGQLLSFSVIKIINETVNNVAQRALIASYLKKEWYNNFIVFCWKK